MGSYKQMVLLPPYPLLASHWSLVGITEDSYDLNIFCHIVKLWVLTGKHRHVLGPPKVTHCNQNKIKVVFLACRPHLSPTVPASILPLTKPLQLHWSFRFSKMPACSCLRAFVLAVPSPECFSFWLAPSGQMSPPPRGHLFSPSWPKISLPCSTIFIALITYLHACLFIYAMSPIRM